jgi:hypothetical protein
VSGRGGSGNFGSGRMHRRARADQPLAGWVGMPSGTDITLAGSHCRDPPAIVSQAGLQARPCRLPGPVTRYVQVYPSVGFSSPRSQQASTPPPLRAPETVCGAERAGLFPKRVCCLFDWGAIFGSLVSWESWESSSRDLRNRAGACWAERGACGAKCAGRISCGALLFCARWAPSYPWWRQQQQQQQQASRSSSSSAAPLAPSVLVVSS